MNGLNWLLAYMVAGFIHSLGMYDEDETAGVLFVDLFLWPIPLGTIFLSSLGEAIADGIDYMVVLLAKDREEEDDE